jgi:hypothetical protein
VFELCFCNVKLLSISKKAINTDNIKLRYLNISVCNTKLYQPYRKFQIHDSFPAVINFEKKKKLFPNSAVNYICTLIVCFGVICNFGTLPKFYCIIVPVFLCRLKNLNCRRNVRSFLTGNITEK